MLQHENHRGYNSINIAYKQAEAQIRLICQSSTTLKQHAVLIPKRGLSLGSQLSRTNQPMTIFTQNGTFIQLRLSNHSPNPSPLSNLSSLKPHQQYSTIIPLQKKLYTTC